MEFPFEFTSEKNKKKRPRPLFFGGNFRLFKKNNLHLRDENKNKYKVLLPYLIRKAKLCIKI